MHPTVRSLVFNESSTLWHEHTGWVDDAIISSTRSPVVHSPKQVPQVDPPDRLSYCAPLR